MNKQAIVIVAALCIVALVVGAPIAQAQVVSYIPSWLTSILNGAGVYGIIAGAAVIAGGYIVYHASSTVYSYFTAYKYSTVSSHAYTEHGTHFPNIWSTKPPKSTFDKKCKDNMNSKSAQKYIQKYDKRLISYNPSTEMVSVGETDGKTVVTCFPKSNADVLKKVRTGEWIKVTVK